MPPKQQFHESGQKENQKEGRQEERKEGKKKKERKEGKEEGEKKVLKLRFVFYLPPPQNDNFLITFFPTGVYVSHHKGSSFGRPMMIYNSTSCKVKIQFGRLFPSYI